VTVQKQYSESVQLNQSLFNGFTDVGKIEQGHANLLAAQAQLDLEKVTLNASLKTAFAQLLFEQKSVELTAAILSRQQVNLRMIDLRFKGGNENKGSLLFQQATVAQAQFQHDHAVRQLRNAIKQLGALWGEPDLKELTVVGELAGHTPATNLNFEQLAVAHPNHVNYVEQLNSAQAAVKIADGGWYPNLNLIASAGDVGPSWPPDSNRWSAGVSLTFPFFPGTSQIYSAQSARAQKLQAEYTKNSTDFKLIAALENAYEGLLDALAQVQVNEQFQTAAEARSRIANGKYNTGLMTFEDWTVIDQDLVNREQNLLQSQLNAMQAEATWESAEGVGDLL
jgi:outer membrane protein TolC